MARQKQTKTTGTNKSNDDVVDGMAYEKMDGGQAAGGSEQPIPAKRSSRIVRLVAISALVFVVAGVVGAFYLYKGIVEETSHQGREDLNELASQLADAQDEIGKAHTRLGGLEENLQKIQGNIESQAKMAVNAQTDYRDALEARLAAIDQRLADLTPLASGPQADLGSSSSAPSKPTTAEPLTDMTASDQFAVAIVMALLADDATGRPLERWIPALVAFGQHRTNTDSQATDTKELVDRVITSVKTNPASAKALIADGVRLTTMMAVAANDAGDNATLFEKATASLRQLVKLRALSATTDDARGQLVRFERALDWHDLQAAVDIATSWNGPSLPALATWRDQAIARLVLDRALGDLAAEVLNNLPSVNTAQTGAGSEN